MGTEAPTIITIPVHCAPKKAPCPTCGRPGRRARILPPRRVRTVAYRAIAYLEITGGEYRARCDCCTTFRNTPDGILPRAAYDNTVRDLVLGRIIEDGMSIERALRSLRREFLLEKQAFSSPMTNLSRTDEDLSRPTHEIKRVGRSLS